MPIVDDEDRVALVEQPNTVRIAAPEFKGVVVDTRYVPASALLTNIEGSSWHVNYYSQVLDDDNAVQGQNPTRNAIYQQYKLIKGFEFKVTTPLTTSQDDDTKTMRLTGSANIYPFLIPNVGDMFLADIGDGRQGIFKITMSERKSIFKDTCHFVEYQLIDYGEGERLIDLDGKVIQTLQYVKDFLTHGQNPLLYEEDYLILQKLHGWYLDLVPKYFKWFFSREYKTLLVPGQPVPTYDPYLTKAVVSFFDTREAVEIRHIRVLNTDGDPAMHSTNIWDALTTKDHRLLRHAFKRFGLISAKTFDRNAMFEGIYYSGIAQVVYPKDPELWVEYDFQKKSKSVLDDTLVTQHTQISSLKDVFAENTLFHGLPFEKSVTIHDVTDDDYYVFTEAFYEELAEDDEGRPAQSKLELCVRDYLNGKALDNKVLLALCQTCHAWGGLERFYFMPVLLILLRASIRSI